MIIDGKSFRVVKNVETTLVVDGRTLKVTVRPAPLRLFRQKEFQFQYPSGLGLEKEESEFGPLWKIGDDERGIAIMRISMDSDEEFDGRQVSLFRNIPEIDEEPVTIALQGRRIQGTRVSLSQEGRTVYQVRMFNFTAGDGKYLMMLFESLDENGGRKKESSQLFDQFEQSFRWTAESIDEGSKGTPSKK